MSKRRTTQGPKAVGQCSQCDKDWVGEKEKRNPKKERTKGMRERKREMLQDALHSVRPDKNRQMCKKVTQN